MKNRKSKHLGVAVAVIIAAVAVGLYALEGYFVARAWESAADVVYEMTNKNIDWTYAGKDGAGK